MWTPSLLACIWYFGLWSENKAKWAACCMVSRTQNERAECEVQYPRLPYSASDLSPQDPASQRVHTSQQFMARDQVYNTRPLGATPFVLKGYEYLSCMYVSTGSAHRSQRVLDLSSSKAQQNQMEKLSWNKKQYSNGGEWGELRSCKRSWVTPIKGKKVGSLFIAVIHQELVQFWWQADILLNEWILSLIIIIFSHLTGLSFQGYTFLLSTWTLKIIKLFSVFICNSCEGRRTTCEVGSLLPPCEFWRPDSLSGLATSSLLSYLDSSFPFLKKTKYIYFYVCEYFTCLYVCAWYLQSSKDGFRFPRTAPWSFAPRTLSGAPAPPSHSFRCPQCVPFPTHIFPEPFFF